MSRSDLSEIKDRLVDNTVVWRGGIGLNSRVLRVIWLNLAVSLTLAFGIWAVRSKAGQAHPLSGEILISLIHGTIYGCLFGFGLPYLSARLSLLRRPWNSVSITVSIAVVAVLGTFLVELSLLGLGYLDRADFREEFSYKSVVVGVLALLIGWGVYLYEGVWSHVQTMSLQLRTKELEKERALKLATEAQLASLESKLHPHFLFNTLNSISALISTDPSLADKMVQRLAGLLRTSLDATNRKSLSLDEEIALVRAYLEIETARFGERLRYSIEVESETRAIQIPPLILQPLVENSIKFAVFPRLAGGKIMVTAALRASRLTMEVGDDGPGFDANMIPRGHGLDNLRARLHSLFGDEAGLSINASESGTRVSVCLPRAALATVE